MTSAPDRVTRGRTQPGRLRALDAFLLRSERALLERSGGEWTNAPVMDVGFGEHPWTTLELHSAFREVNLALDVVGIDREPHRVEAAQAHAREGVRFLRAGFEQVNQLSSRPRLVRAMNVLRAYPAREIPQAHQALGAPLLEGGLLVDGSADPEGSLLTAHLIRRTPEGLFREALWFSTSFQRGFAPIQFRDWLPRDLRRRVVPGEPILAFLDAWTAAWSEARASGAETPRQVFERTSELVAQQLPGVNAPSIDVTGGRGELLWRPPGGVPEPLTRA